MASRVTSKRKRKARQRDENWKTKLGSWGLVPAAPFSGMPLIIYLCEMTREEILLLHTVRWRKASLYAAGTGQVSSQMKTSSQSHPVSSESAKPPLLIVPYIHDSLSGGKEASPSPHNSLWSVSVSSAAVRLGSVGAGGDGVVQLDVQGRRGRLQAAETRITHATGLKQLLAWHRDLLIATAGTEHIPTIPAGAAEVRRRKSEKEFRKGKKEKNRISAFINNS